MKIEEVRFLTDKSFKGACLESVLKETKKVLCENSWLKEHTKPLNTCTLCRQVSEVFSKWFKVPCITGFRVSGKTLTFTVLSFKNFDVNAFALCEFDKDA